MLGFTLRSGHPRKERTIRRIRLQFAMLGHPLDHLSDADIRRGVCRFAELCRDSAKGQQPIAQFVYPPVFRRIRFSSPGSLAASSLRASNPKKRRKLFCQRGKHSNHIGRREGVFRLQIRGFWRSGLPEADSV